MRPQKGAPLGGAVERSETEEASLAPHQGAFDGLVPAVQKLGAAGAVHGGVKLLVHGPVVADILGALPVAHGQTGQIGRAQSGGLDAMSLWNCIKKSFAQAPPSTFRSVTLMPESCSMALQISKVW